MAKFVAVVVDCSLVGERHNHPVVEVENLDFEVLSSHSILWIKYRLEDLLVFT